MISKMIHGDCKEYLSNPDIQFDLTFLDPPFNQNKEYRSHHDNMDHDKYWEWMETICNGIFANTTQGGAIYFMQREKNVHFVIETLIKTGWSFQNLIIWKKKSSAVPENFRYGKHHQVIVFATKGERPRVFNKLRIDPPLLVTEKYKRKTGMYVTDVWDDIRELTSGYFAGDEPLRFDDGTRVHNQQSPIALLLRIILASTHPEDVVFDPFAGTGTTLVVATQLSRQAVGVEIDPVNISHIEKRLKWIRKSDEILKYRKDYLFTEKLEELWPAKMLEIDQIFQKDFQYALFEHKKDDKYSVNDHE